MNYKTVEVELENGRVRPSGSETLPSKAHALLTLFDDDAAATGTVPTCAELAKRWASLDKLPPAEAAAFADDIEQARADLPPQKSAWD